VAKGYHVKALAQYNSFNNWGWLEHVNCKNDIVGKSSHDQKISKKWNISLSASEVRLL
jgi:hypothetical protein